METITDNSTTATAEANTFPSSPFVGLRPFDSDEALLFFGRREQTVELLQQLHRTHFIAVVGSSGCGKSSLIRAGLIPKLKAGFLVEDLDQWRVAVMKPGDGPIKNLAAALLGAVSGDVDDQEVERLVEQIGQFGAEAILMRLAPALHDSSNLLLLVDQFEEIFRFGVESGKLEQRAEAEDFVSLMLALAERRKLPIYVVMTMRSDFLGDCDNFYGLPEAMNRSQYLVPRLTRQQRQQAIEGPIRLFGASISPRLLDRVLNDVGDRSDQLPVMQHALLRTWEHWRQSGDPQIDIEDYKAVGTIEDALSNDANSALVGLNDEELSVTQRIFQALTDADARGRRIRRPAHLSELVAITGAPREQVWKIINRFRSAGRSFITVTGDADPFIDITHESLIRQWDRMSEWVESEVQSRDMYLRAADAANLYQKLGKDDLLWKGTQLDLALEWLENIKPNVEWADRYRSGFEETVGFLKKSKEVRDAEVAQQNKLRKRSQRIAWGVTSIIIGLLVALVIFGWFANQQDTNYRQKIYRGDMNTADEEFRNGRFSRSIDLLARYVRDTDSWLNFFQKDVRDEQWRILWQLNHDEFATLKGHKSWVLSVAFSPDGKTLATAGLEEHGSDYTVKLWDVASRQNVASLEGPQRNDRSVAFSPDGKTLATWSSDETVKLWDVASRQNVATLKGHESYVSSVAFSPDGKTLATGSSDHTVKLWDVASRQNVATLKGHESSISSVAFSSDGKTLATAGGDLYGSDNTVKLWDVASRQNVATLKGHEHFADAVAISPDGKTLATADGDLYSSDNTVKLWDVASRQNVATLKGHESPVNSVAFSPDGKTLATASGDFRGRDNTVKLWDVASRQNVATLKGHESSVNSVAFSPDGKTLATASGDIYGRDNTAKLWDVASRHVATLRGHESPVDSVAFSPDGKTLATAGGDSIGGDKTVKLWDVASRQNVASLEGPQRDVKSVAFSPDGKTLATGSSDHTVKLWDVASRQDLATLIGHESYVLSVAFSPDGKTLATGSSDKTVKLWDVDSRQNVATLKGHESSVNSVAFSSDGKTLATAGGYLYGSDKTVKLWDVASRQNVATLRPHESPVSSVAFSPDGKTLATASGNIHVRDKTVELWDVASRQNVATLKGHESSVNSVAFSPDGKTLASASSDRTVKLWDVASRQNVATLKGHEYSVLSVAFSPDGKTLATGSQDWTVKLWDVAPRQNVAALKGHEQYVNSVAFSPDGKTLASASSDRTVKLWDVASRQNVATLKGHERGVLSVAYSPDGKTLASAGGDNEKKDFAIRLWFAATDKEVARQRNK